MNWSARGNVLNQYLRNTSIGTTVIEIAVYFICGLVPFRAGAVTSHLDSGSMYMSQNEVLSSSLTACVAIAVSTSSFL